MFAVNTYDEIEKKERSLDERHVIVLLFVKPSLKGASEIIDEFNYLHHNAQNYCSIYAVGYSDNNSKGAYDDFKKVRGINNSDWYYSDQALVDFKNKLEDRLKWRYSGEAELIVLQSNPESKNILDFRNHLVVDINYGIKNGYLESFPRFMESLIRHSKKHVEAKDIAKGVHTERYKLKDIVCTAIEDCKKVPKPLKRIIKDTLFFRTAKSYG